MAAVAVAGAASAQVTITGEIAYGWQSSTEVVGSDSRAERAGFGVDTSAVTFAASEDLGDGMSVSGSTTIGGINRSAEITGEDHIMTFNAGSMGSFSFQNVEIGSGIRDIGSAGAPVNNMEGEILGEAGDGNIAKYTFPAMIDGVTLSVSRVSGDAEMGQGDSNGDPTSNSIAVEYAAGALTAKVDYANYQANLLGYTSKTRVAASYDIGMFKVGFGNESNSAADAADADKYTIIGLSRPIGSNMTVGAVRVTKRIGTAETLDGTSYGVKYNLSKRTNLSASVTNWDASSTVRSDKTKIVLSHTF